MSNVEFLVHEVQQDGEIIRVSGIVNKGKVSLNDDFASVRSESGSESPVQLRVSSITAYRRTIAELPTGVSGELHLTGEGCGLLGSNCMLSG